jgi:hypothetical protein
MEQPSVMWINYHPSARETVLRDIIESGAAPVLLFDGDLSSGRSQQIVTNAHRIQNGEMQERQSRGAESDLYFVERSDPEQIRDSLIEVVVRRIPARLMVDPIRDIQHLQAIFGRNGIRLQIPSCANGNSANAHTTSN